MPELMIGSPADELDFELLRDRLVALTAWPDDGAARREYLALRWISMRDRAQEGLGRMDLDENSSAADVREHDELVATLTRIDRLDHSLPVRIAAVARMSRGFDILNDDLQRRMHQWQWVSRILGIILCLEVDHGAEFGGAKGGGSVRKATGLLEAIAKDRQHLGLEPEYPVHERMIMKVWSMFKPVAHLCAGWQTACACPAATAEHTVKLWLGSAKFFQDFGTRFVPQRQKVPLLDPAVVYMIPENAPIERPDGVSVERLTEEELVILRTYAAGR